MPLYNSQGQVVSPTANLHRPLGPAGPALDGGLADLPGRHPLQARGEGGYMRYRQMTVDEMLLENRVVFLIGEINEASGYNVIMRLLYLQSIRKDQDIMLYINSPGGHVDDTLAIYDTMKFLSCDVQTFCIGQAMSGAAVILAAGAKGKRYALPHAKVMIHQPFGGIYGQTADIVIQAEEILKTKETLIDLLAKLTGQPRERIAEDQERDKYFDAHAAHAYGIVDEVLEEGDIKKKEEIATQQESRPQR
jgi:ATP-dependent Clp protease protease subunit